MWDKINDAFIWVGKKTEESIKNSNTLAGLGWFKDKTGKVIGKAGNAVDETITKLLVIVGAVLLLAVIITRR